MRHLASAIAALALSSSLAAQGPLRVPVTVDTLPNGLTLIIHRDPSVPVVTTNVWYHVGSGDEKVGRTGFAHLFEHLMFMGSKNAPYPQFDRLLEAAGANNNGSTNPDRTNYYESGPASALPLMLWLEADRLGWMLETMDAPKVDLQRDVVKNERRQSYENQPYGLAFEHLVAAIYPKGHPYSWSTIGSMADLSAASLEDVKDFFRTYYTPNNASIVVAGAVNVDSVRALARQMFGEIPRGPAIERPRPAPFTLRDTTIVLEDRVQLPRVYLAWHAVPEFSADDAALDVAAYILAGARNSRLTQALVFQRELATNASAFNSSKRLDGDFQVVATARPGIALDSLTRVIDAELRRLASEPPTARELEQAKNSIEASFLNGLEFVDAKADRLNAYYYATGTPDYFQQDLDRYRRVTAADVSRVVRQYLLTGRVTLSVVPQGRTNLAATPRVTQ
ncbi:pitrilysin family protein [Pseudogemmatithrix spongiicola]|uniref:Pitrilysin family protein n=1 Tax=Pseudogemmatithrix spongiicola TaxID=3062599 RepID=A0AA49Q5T4_9BACT|nr:pitrilysin family protein [Gemmatimonadaceae bacterium 'strain 138']WKW16524.1 pitrilysin family protein [Gemmatimonadaceae bacterium 'strain 318']